MSDKSYKRFAKVYSKFIKPMDIGGVIVYDTGKKETISLYNTFVEVPVLSIKNPSDLPFSYNSLKEQVATEIEYFNDLSSAGLSGYQIPNFIVFDYFTYNEYYYPDRLVKEFKNCLSSGNFETKYRNNKNQIYTIYFKYNMSDFDMFWDNSEVLIIDVNIKVGKVWFEDLVKSESYFMEFNDSELFDLIDEFKYDDRDVLLDPVWKSCIVPYIVNYPSFFNYEWQIVDMNVIPIT